MLIATDIGNSSITIGYFVETGLVVQRIPTHPLQKADEYRQLLLAFMAEKNIAKSACTGIISSVVPGHTEVFSAVLAGLSEEGTADILVVNSMISGIGFRIPAPEELGTDRIANAVAAFSLFKRPAAVIDFGSATTITVVDRQGFYIGGSIMPGIGLMNESLGTKTSKLMQVELKAPESVLGRDTPGCILTGLLIGTAGAVERIVEEMEAETGLVFNTILTGGYCMLLESFVRRPHLVKPELTLEGLKILYEKNRSQ
ncbi:MAG: type III pantothenate kinase [Nitrospirota bacterium]|nr:type III pantothenate kinase [Nitrospirota bacterium]